MKKEDIEPFFAALAQKNPHPKTELVYTNHYTLLVAVVLSAQATDVGVNKATKALFARVSTPEQMVDLGEAGLKDYIKTIGLYNSKAKNVIALSQALIAEHGGKVPRDRDALEKLPGVGRKTANVVLNEGFGEPMLAVDTHVFRVGNRTGVGPGRTPREVEDALMKRVPAKYLKDAHHLLILHGRYVCVARAPKCEICVVAQWCDYAKKAAAQTKTARKAAPSSKKKLS